MHREACVTVLLTSVGLFGGATGCNKPPSVEPDTVSGCLAGAKRVKVLIELESKDGRCLPEVTPASVCVAPAGVVWFKIQNGRMEKSRIQNGCEFPSDQAGPAVEIGQPSFKRRLDGPKDGAMGSKELFLNCPLRIDRLENGASRSFKCDVPTDAIPGFYKYGLTGQIVTLDPDVEVHP